MIKFDIYLNTIEIFTFLISVQDILKEAAVIYMHTDGNCKHKVIATRHIASILCSHLIFLKTAAVDL